MAPIGSDHSGTVNELSCALFKAVGDLGIVSVQGPIRLSDRTEPQPDFAILRPRADFYRTSHPGRDDILLLVEVAQSGLDYDREVKGRLYARAGIVEYWIADLVGREVEVCRLPGADGYGSVRRFGGGGSLDIAALPGVRIPSSVILG